MKKAENIAIIGLSFGDPWQPATWSNNPYYLFSNLKKMGYLEFAWGENPSPLQNRLAQIWSAFRFGTFKKKEMGHLAPRFYLSRVMNRKFFKTLETDNIVKKADKMVVLSTSSFVGIDNIPFPIFLYGDQNFLQLYRGNPEVQQAISSKVLKKIIDYEKNVSEKCAGIFCFSQWMNNSIVNDYGIDQQKVHVVGHGYCLPEIADFDKKTVEQPIILFVVTNWLKKGGDIVLKAFQYVKEKMPEIQLHIVGRIPADRQAQVKSAPIVYHGFLNKNKPDELEKLIELYQKAAVFVLPSVFDPMPNITLEANYLKTPVVTSNVCGIPEQVIDGETGYVIPEMNPELYAEKILRLMNDSQLRHNMGNQGRQFVEKHFSWQAVIGKMVKIFNRN